MGEGLGECYLAELATKFVGVGFNEKAIAWEQDNLTYADEEEDSFVQNDEMSPMGYGKMANYLICLCSYPKKEE